MLNVQADIRERLQAALPDVAVRVSVPADRPARLVVVRRSGGSERNALIDAPGVEMQCWGVTEAEACELAHSVAAAMRSLAFADGYASVEQQTMHSDYDQLARSPRWYLDYSLRTYTPNKKENA